MKGDRFKGKIAIITGSGKGMGKQTALDMAAEGAVVIVADIDQVGMDETRNEIITLKGQSESILCDVSKRTQVDLLISTVKEKYGRIDILINNAGLLLPGTIEETTDKIINDTIDINIKGILYAIRAISPIMKEQKYGRIINVASITGKNGDNSTVFVYGASKGAVISLTRSVARQLGPFGVTCNAIAPHAVMTAMMQYWPDAKKRAMAEKIPVRRLGTEQDMSWLMCFLASDQAGFINGETVNINGGYYMD
ncbi:MAG: SDR family oxidoreductase [Bacteroidetes bacterium]|nr:SDR family oxidoreductase [Bacteroidota bacterium]